MFGLKFWGVRGSIPCPGPLTARYGGNTSSIQILNDKGYVIMLDLGTGVRDLAASILQDPAIRKPLQIHIFLTHTHWDHIMGFPFFVPIYIPDSEITIYGPVSFEEDPLEKVVGGQLTYRYFPVRQDELRSKINYVPLKEGSRELPGGIVVRYIFLNHPILCLGYRFEYEGKVICTCYDHEPFLNLFKGDPDTEAEGQAVVDESNARIAGFMQDADLLVHDSQYTTREYAKFTGWGHSTYGYAVEQAMKARAKRLAFFHHDPQRTDKQLDKVKATFQKVYKKKKIDIFPAMEKMEIIV